MIEALCLPVCVNLLIDYAFVCGYVPDGKRLGLSFKHTHAHANTNQHTSTPLKGSQAL